MSSSSTLSGPSSSHSVSRERRVSNTATVGDASYNGAEGNCGIMTGGLSMFGGSLNVYNKILGGGLSDHQLHNEFNQCLQWLNPRSQRQLIEDATADEPYLRDTCEWFLRINKYALWEKSLGPQVLILVGTPRMGKTFVCRFLKSRLSETIMSPGTPPRTVAYYFCDYHVERSTSTAVVAGLLEQLLQAHRDKFRSVRDAYFLYTRSSSHDFGKLWYMFRRLLTQLTDDVFIIVDGLDKCPRVAILQLLRLVQSVINIERFDLNGNACNPIKFLLTSRSERYFSVIKRLSRQMIRQHDIADPLAKSVSAFIENEVSTLPFKTSPQYREKLGRKIHKKAGGTYLWAAMVLEKLRTVEGHDAAVCRREADDILRYFPKDLKRVYDRMLAEINLSSAWSARLVLSIIAMSRRTITQEELALLHLSYLDPQEVEEDGLPSLSRLKDLSTLHTVCGSLLDLRGKTISLVHDSLQEYLLSTMLARRYASRTLLMRQRSSIFFHYSTYRRVLLCVEKVLGTVGLLKGISQFHITPQATHLMIFQLCWKCLCTSRLDEGSKLIKTEGDELLPNSESTRVIQSYPALRYPMQEWLGHALAARDELLSPKQQGWLRENLRRLPTLRDRWLHEVVYAGDSEMAQMLLNHGADPDTCWGEYGCILHRPAHEGNETLVNILLDHGADIDAKGKLFDNAIHAAAHRSHANMVALLLERKAKIHYSPDGRCAALQAAVENDHKQIVQLLLENEKRVGSRRGRRDWRTLSQKATTWGREQASRSPHQPGRKGEVGGRDTDAEDQGRTYALKRASSFGLLEIVQLLVKHDAKINARGGEHGTALDAARDGGHTNIVEWLRENGAKESTEEDFGAGPVYLAAKAGNLEGLQRLMNEEHDVNLPGGRYGHPLQVAAFHRHIEIAQFLIDKGADIHASGGCCGNALHAAIEGNSLEIVEILLDLGVDIDVPRGSHASPLHTAACCGREAIVCHLLARGASVNAEGGRYGNPLQAAAFHGYETVAKLLLDANADPNAKGGVFGNALYAAVVHGRKESLVAMLLDHGADPNARGGPLGFALSAAVQSGNEGVVRLLLGCHADVDAAEGEHGTALHVAAAQGNESLISLLLSDKAQPQVKDKKGRTVAEVAKLNGHEELAKLLARLTSKRGTRRFAYTSRSCLPWLWRKKK